MPEHKRVFVTGATGFLGSHLAFRFLEHGDHVSILARASRTASARDRAIETLREVAGPEANVEPLFRQLEVVEGDISQPDFGLSAETKRKLISSIDEIWHCAASLSFADEDREDIFRMNVGGTENLLRLAEQIPSRRLQHVSTAYVCGNRTDLVKETDIDVGQSFKNAYEESKCRSELLIEKAHRDKAVRASVYRPSIVIGDAQTGRTTHFHGVYAFIRGLWTALERLRRRFPDETVIQLPLRVLGSGSTTLNFVPINYVVDAMIAIGHQPTAIGKTFHLTNEHSTPNNVWLSNITRILKLQGVELVNEDSFVKTPMTRLEALFQKQMAFYYMYLQSEPRFDATNTLAALKGTRIACPPMGVELIEMMAGWYADYLNRKDQD